MSKALIAISIAIASLAIIFKYIGGVFDKPFWLAFVPGLLANLVILAVAVFVIDRIFQQDRWRKLERINASQSKFVLFLTNRLAFWLLDYLDLTAKEEVTKDPQLNFEFAIEKIKESRVAATFFEKFEQSNNKQEFIDGFTKKVTDGINCISKALGTIYPHAEADVNALLEELSSSSAMVSAFGMLDKAINEANKKVQPGEQLKPEQVDLLFKIGYAAPAEAMEKIINCITALSDKAKENKLFASLD